MWKMNDGIIMVVAAVIDDGELLYFLQSSLVTKAWKPFSFFFGY